MKTLRIQTLGKGWRDTDEVLLHAAFQLLVDFVEKEKPAKNVDWSHNAELRRAWKEIQGLYRWWKKERPKRKSPLDNKKLKRPPLKFETIPGKPGWHRQIGPDRKKYAAYFRALRQHHKLTQKWYAEDSRNLHRLIDVRGYLWT